MAKHTFFDPVRKEREREKLCFALYAGTSQCSQTPDHPTTLLPFPPSPAAAARIETSGLNPWTSHHPFLYHLLNA